MSWIEEEYKTIIERVASDRRFILNVATVAHTPQTKEGARSVSKRYKSLLDSVEAMTPWNEDAVKSKKKELLRKARELSKEHGIEDSTLRKD